MNWTNLERIEQIEEVVLQSKTVTCLIFKHSTSCNMSAMAKYKLEEDWTFSENEVRPFMVDILKYKNISNAISEEFQEYHQSPQVLLIKEGECFYEESHLDISVEDIQETVVSVCN
ncbi:MAG: bacillithiol system redox-active protein YtxJ [Saprospiraceae bacterium]